MARGTPIEPAVKERVAALLRAGQPNAAVIRATGVSTWTVKEVAKEIGIYRGAKGKLLTKEEFERVTAKRLATKRGTPSNGAATKPPPEPKTAVTGVSDAIRIESNKYRLLEKIVKHGPYATLRDLTSASHDWPDIRLSGHEIEHLVRGLQREGKVSYREGANSAHGMTLRRIEATVVGRHYIRTLTSPAAKQNEKPVSLHGPVERILPDAHVTQAPGIHARLNPNVAAATVKAAAQLEPEARTAAIANPPTSPYPQRSADRTDFRTHGKQAEGGPIERVTAAAAELAAATVEAVKAVEAEAAHWPELAALRSKGVEKHDAEQKAEKYLEAAALLEPIDATEARRLSGIANELVAMYTLSRVEAEYLAYAEQCEKKK